MVHGHFVPEKSYLRYLLEDKNIKLTEEEAVIKEVDDMTFGNTFDFAKAIAIQKENKAIFDAFDQKYKSTYMPEYKEKYIDKPMATKAVDDENKTLKEWRLKDSILVSDLDIRPNLISQVIKTRDLKNTFESMSKEDATPIMAGMDTYVKHPFLQAEARRIFSLTYPPEGEDRYELPQTQAANVFRDIIAPFKGKYILVDFWDMYCGPCVATIKSTKEKRKEQVGNLDIEFIFITSTYGSPISLYNRFVEEWELVHTYRLSDDNYNRLRELFKFSGIPHYETVDREGRIMRKSIIPYNFDYDFGQLMKSEKK